MKRTANALALSLLFIMLAAGCSKPADKGTKDKAKPAATEKAPGPDTPVPKAQGQPEARPEQEPGGPAPVNTSEWQDLPAPDEDAVRALVEPLLDPCAPLAAKRLAAPLAETVEYEDWAPVQALPRDTFIHDVLTWRCQALTEPDNYETIPVDQRIVNVFTAGPGGHKFAEHFHPSGTGVTKENLMRCDHVVPPGEARVLVADRILQGETLSWPPFGEWQGYMYYIKTIDGALKVYKYGACPEYDIMDLSIEPLEE